MEYTMKLCSGKRKAAICCKKNTLEIKKKKMLAGIISTFFWNAYS